MAKESAEILPGFCGVISGFDAFLGGETEVKSLFCNDMIRYIGEGVGVDAIWAGGFEVDGQASRGAHEMIVRVLGLIDCKVAEDFFCGAFRPALRFRQRG